MKCARLFDHIITARNERRRHGKSEGLGGIEVDDQFKFGRRLHRKIGKGGAGLLDGQGAARLVVEVVVKFVASGL